MSQLPPPHYVLFSHSSFSPSTSSIPSQTLGHPIIQYHYANDSPLALLPQSPDEHVLVLDYEPISTGPQIAQSLSKDLVVSFLKYEEAPGAAAAGNADLRSDKMCVIGTTAMTNGIPDGLTSDLKSGLSVLEQFRRRNAVLRQVLSYPGPDQSSTQLKLSH